MSKTCFRLLVLFGLPLSVMGCHIGTTRLDEATLFDDVGFKMKVVRYFERLPLSFWGEIATVQCASNGTLSRPAGETNDQGWVAVDRFVALGTRNAGELLKKTQEHILFKSGKILVWNHGMVLSFTFDGCGNFKRWDIRDLPSEWVVPAHLPDYCKPHGTVDCKPRDFLFAGDQVPIFSNVSVHEDGNVSFTVGSKAFVETTALSVSSADYGKTWIINK